MAYHNNNNYLEWEWSILHIKVDKGILVSPKTYISKMYQRMKISTILICIVNPKLYILAVSFVYNI